METAEAKLETDRVTEEKRLLQEELNGVKKVSHQFLNTVNSRKSQTLFISLDFRWLMVAKIFRK